MSYRIAQDSHYVGNNYWKWSAWIDADASDLDRITEVVWILHPTFLQSRVRVTDRPSKFRLETSGWGVFLLRAELLLGNGETKMLSHTLRLEGGDAMTRSGDRPLSVFLSYSTQDARDAAKVRKELTKAGIEVLDQTRIEAGQSWNETLESMLTHADAIVGLVGEDEISPWVRSEMQAATAAEKPALALLTRDARGTGIPGNVQLLKVDVNRFDPEEVAAPLRTKKRG